MSNTGPSMIDMMPTKTFPLIMSVLVGTVFPRMFSSYRAGSACQRSVKCYFGTNQRCGITHGALEKNIHISNLVLLVGTSSFAARNAVG